jgi:abortive infection bacteriophage resistance protein
MLAAQTGSVLLWHNTHTVLPKLQYDCQDNDDARCMCKTCCLSAMCYSKCPVKAECMQMGPLDLVESCSSVLQVQAGMENMTYKFIAAEV